MKQTNCYIVAAKMDDGDGPFDDDLVEKNYPDNYALVPGHVWLVRSETASSHDVATTLGLATGGIEDASGIVVPAKGYWGFGHKTLRRFLAPGPSADTDSLREHGKLKRLMANRR